MKRKALFIGVNEYEDAQIRNLSYSLSDAHSLKAMFELFGYETDILENPDKSAVLRTVKEMTSDLSAGDFFLFYFAGHGWTTAGGKHLLFCKDDLYEDLRYDYNVGIPFDVLKKRTEGGGFDRAFVLDACRTDFITGARGGDETTRDLRPIGEFVRNAPVRSSLAVLRSCSKYEHALEIDSRKHGLFTLALLDVLRQARDGGRELLFGEPLCDAVAARMFSIARDEGLAVSQTPEFAKSGAARVLVCGRGEASPPSSEGAARFVTCPVCGQHNHPTDTFRCLVCGRDFLCRKHRSDGGNSCTACAEAAAEEKRRMALEMFEKGEEFYYGRNGVTQNFGEAAKWFCKSAEQGNAEAQKNLGGCFCSGLGVTLKLC